MRSSVANNYRVTDLFGLSRGNSISVWPHLFACFSTSNNYCCGRTGLRSGEDIFFGIFRCLLNNCLVFPIQSKSIRGNGHTRCSAYTKIADNFNFIFTYLISLICIIHEIQFTGLMHITQAGKKRLKEFF